MNNGIQQILFQNYFVLVKVTGYPQIIFFEE